MQWGSGSNWDTSSLRARVRDLSGTAAIGAGHLGKMRADVTAAKQGIEDGRKQQMFGGAIDTMRSGMDFGPMSSRTSSGGLGFMDPKDSLNLVKTKAIAGFGSSVGPSIFAQKSGGGGGGGGGGVLEWPEDKHKREMEMQALKNRGQIGQASATAEGQVASERARARGLLDLQRQTARDQRSADYWNQSNQRLQELRSNPYTDSRINPGGRLRPDGGEGEGGGSIFSGAESFLKD